MMHGGHRLDGIAGGAIGFNGENNYVDFAPTPAFRLMEDASVSLLVNRHSEHFTLLGIENGLSEVEENNAVFYLSIVGNARLRYIHEHGEGRNEEYNFTPLPEDEWVHVVVTRDRKNRLVRVYFNGIHQGDFHYGGHPPNPSDELAMTLGGRSRDTDNYWGMIDELVLLRRTLSSDDIDLLFWTGVAGAPLNITLNPDPLS